MIFIGMYYVLRNMMGPMFPAFTVKQGIFYIFVVWVDIFFTYTVSVSIVGEGNVSYSYLLLWCAIIGRECRCAGAVPSPVFSPRTRLPSSQFRLFPCTWRTSRRTNARRRSSW